MRYDKNKAFPYPVLRPDIDDYIDVEFQVMVDFTIANSHIKAAINFALSSEEIQNEIDSGNAEYICVISCRDTYVQRVVATKDRKIEAMFDIGSLRGEVRVDPYVVVRNEITEFSSPDINPEFGSGPFTFQAGDVLAQDESMVFYIDRDLFKPVTSVLDMVKKEGLSDGVWTINFEEDHIQIELNPKMKQAIDDARNDTKNRIVLKNSIYFAAIMQAVQKLQDPNESYEGKKWAEVIEKQAHNMGLDLKNRDAYLITEHLMQLPMLQLENYVFRGVVS